VLDTAVNRALAGETTADEAIAEIVTGWEEITEELGRDQQQAAYKASLGVTK
jgi:multiple sugar transport system substrate-binding protein